MSFWCGDVWTSRKSHPFFSLPISLLYRCNLSASELNFNEKIIWNWKCKIIKSSIKSNEKFNESRKGGLSETHQSERLGAAPPAWASGKQRHCCHICRAYRASSPPSLSAAWTATIKQVEQNDALQCFSQPFVHTLKYTSTHTHTHTHIF